MSGDNVVPLKRPKASESAARTDLRRLRATLRAWGVSGPELLAFDAWGAWTSALLVAKKVGQGEPPEAKAFASLDDAVRCALELKLAAERAGAGLAPSVRGPLWRMGSEGFEVVHALLVRLSQKGGAR